MDSSALLLWGLIFSSIGVGYFMYGRRRKSMLFRYTGITLIFYPYFVSSVIALVLIGLVLLMLPKLLKSAF